MCLPLQEHTVSFGNVPLSTSGVPTSVGHDPAKLPTNPLTTSQRPFTDDNTWPLDNLPYTPSLSDNLPGRQTPFERRGVAFIYSLRVLQRFSTFDFTLDSWIRYSPQNLWINPMKILFVLFSLHSCFSCAQCPPFPPFLMLHNRLKLCVPLFEPRRSFVYLRLCLESSASPMAQGARICIFSAAFAKARAPL